MGLGGELRNYDERLGDVSTDISLKYLKVLSIIDISYYVIFHCIRAVNISDGFDASKHSSVIAHFNQYYVHTGEFDKTIYKLIDSAYRIREKCDYSDFFVASKEDSAIFDAKQFLSLSFMNMIK